MSSFIQSFHSCSVPFHGVLEPPLSPCQLVTIEGVIPEYYVGRDLEKFEIDFLTEENDSAIHFSFRFGKQQVVANSMRGEDWGTEEIHGFPLKIGEEFDIKIKFGDRRCKVFVNNFQFCEYKYRFPLSSIRYLNIRKLVELSVVERHLGHTKIVQCEETPCPNKE